MAKPQGMIGDWDLTKCSPQQISDDTDKLISNLQELSDKAVAVPVEEASYDTVVKVSNSYV